MTGHDSGLIVFKLDRERPAFALYGNTLYYVRDKFVRQHDLNTGIDTSVVSLRRLGSQYVQPRTLSFNPAERALIATSVSLPHSSRVVKSVLNLSISLTDD